jgi:hypothetical protein
VSLQSDFLFKNWPRRGAAIARFSRFQNKCHRKEMYKKRDVMELADWL